MREIIGDITKVQAGIIFQQVNCQNRMGAGVAKAIYTKFPVVKTAYHKYFTRFDAEYLFGKCQLIRVSDNLAVVNSFSQFYFGNARKTGKVYTDVAKLTASIRRTCEKFATQTVYIPKFIGCGLAGANWSEVISTVSDIPNLVVVALP
ncbi:macro domain-containing protein [Ligilactobacillus equi]|uniref:Macro domain-containing protein n=1 Tax=Ligilactobacillus equi DPC 6820 TaxID=1392007 RepID=V7HXB6_9LACO|nr:macro domain-containing protein [Ligilactobacillus equi]ETA74537.1 hypothetical protein LEQ_0402 [Ligilactobacillus equi DPC 6820]